MTKYVATHEYAKQTPNGTLIDVTVSEHDSEREAIESAKRFVADHMDATVLVTRGYTMRWQDNLHVVHADNGVVEVERA